MLTLSVFWGLVTLGLSWIWFIWQINRTAKQSFSVPQSNIWIVFGKQLQNNQLDKDYQLRLARVVQDVSSFLPELVILQGGITAGNSLSEAVAGQAYLTSKVKNPGFKLVLEESSRNTLENLKQTRQYLQAHQLSLKVCLISNRYHLLRCAIMAKNFGFETEYLPAEKEWVMNSKQLAKVLVEAFFLNWYFTGKFISNLLNNQRMLNKIK